jgi:phosphoribosylaminoimidazolecarboxamide formyltransferase/IMP cyclohydrolase
VQTKNGAKKRIFLGKRARVLYFCALYFVYSPRFYSFFAFIMSDLQPSTHIIRRALLSVSDKTGLLDFAKALVECGIELISTGGTAQTLKDAGIPVLSVSDVTHFPEILDGRVKTLHPSIHAGLLAVLDEKSHIHQLEANMIQSIDLAVVNLYPFEATLQKPHVAHAEVIENIDIGGPAMIRASAKNYRWTAVVTNPSRYNALLAELQAHNGAVSDAFRFDLAAEAFAHTAYYDGMVATYFASQQELAKAHSTPATVSGTEDTSESLPESLPETFSLSLRKEQGLRYGENPHQMAGLYNIAGSGVAYNNVFTQLHGKELSYNNILDIDATAKLALEFLEWKSVVGETAVIIKHTNPCGVGSAPTLLEAYKKAYACDTTSAFGGIIALTATLDLDTARVIDEIFTEVVIAPAFQPDALALLQQKKNRRLMTVNFDALKAALRLEIKAIAGGMLVQSADALLWNTAEKRTVTSRTPNETEEIALEYAWRIAKHVKSNAIVYAASDRSLGIGAGQMSRLDSAIIAAKKAERAGISLKGAAVASDAFFPFADGLLEAVEAGATAVIQPGGSVRDEEVISAANERGIAMVMTGVRHFRH